MNFALLFNFNSFEEYKSAFDICAKGFFRSVITEIGMSMYVTGFEYSVQQIHRSESRRGKKQKVLLCLGDMGIGFIAIFNSCASFELH